VSFSKGKDRGEKIYKSYDGYGASSLLETVTPEIDYLCEKRYKILKILRLGGMSTIYQAEDLEEKGICVVKEMSDYYNSPAQKIDAIYRFEAEAYMMVSLNHPGIPGVKNYFVENDKYYLVMEYIKGINLGEMFYIAGSECILEEEVILWGIDICNTLEYLHSQNPPIIHRDINPFNFIKRDGDEKIILIDFGISTPLFEIDSHEVLIGTPGYIAPEQYEGKIDIRSDIYSLGVTLHQLLTGYDPSSGLPFEFPPLRLFRPEISEWMEILIDKALQIDMEERFSDAGEFREALYYGIELLTG